MTKEIPLSRGMTALVDDEDYEIVRMHRWYAFPGKKTFYAATHMRGDRSDRVVFLHRMLLGLATGEPGPDHIDRNGLNNLRSNLRPASNQQNAQNRSKRSDNTSGFKGVWRTDRKALPWTGSVNCGGTRHYIGTFATAEEAAIAYDQKAKEVFGEFACVNFKDDGCAA